jgi:hypothetical protein
MCTHFDNAGTTYVTHKKRFMISTDPNMYRNENNLNV